MTISKDLMQEQRRTFLTQMTVAIKENDNEAYEKAFEQYHASLVDGIKADYDAFVETNDSRILQKRGVRQLTKAETSYYQKLIDASKGEDFKQKLDNFKDPMPETVIDDVFRNLKENHPLLNHINFVNTGFAIRWVLNDHSKQYAVWGEVTEEVKKEITSGFKTINLEHKKLTAFFLLDVVMLDLGPQWIDSYVRTILEDSLACGLEKEVVSGDGLKGPVGADRDIEKGKFNDSTGWPKKTPVKIKSFRPIEYGPVLAKLAKTEKGIGRIFNKVLLVSNMNDYLTKIMPAVTAVDGNGMYVRDVFPFPTEPVISNEIADGEALLMLPGEYFMGVGIGKDGKLTFDDSAKFLEDKRAYKIKMYGNGKMFDNTCSVLLDISELEEFYTVVKAKTENQPAEEVSLQNLETENQTTSDPKENPTENKKTKD